jgi:hypothetical protein
MDGNQGRKRHTAKLGKQNFDKSKIAYRTRKVKGRRHPGYDSEYCARAMEKYLAEGGVITNLNETSIPGHELPYGSNDVTDFLSSGEVHIYSNKYANREF